MKIREMERQDALWATGLCAVTVGGMLLSPAYGFLLLGAGLMLPVLIEVIRG